MVRGGYWVTKGEFGFGQVQFQFGDVETEAARSVTFGVIVHLSISGDDCILGFAVAVERSERGKLGPGDYLCSS